MSKGAHQAKGLGSGQGLSAVSRRAIHRGVHLDASLDSLARAAGCRGAGRFAVSAACQGFRPDERGGAISSSVIVTERQRPLPSGKLRNMATII